MRLKHGLHLACCTNLHGAETWPETFDALQKHTLAVREKVCARGHYGIGLRLSNRAAHELSDHATFLAFRRWLDQHQCYVSTINGFSFGRFRGERIKEQIFMPDWTSPERVAYTNLLTDLLARLLPADIEGTITTVPCSVKGAVTTPDQARIIRTNIWHCIEHACRVSETTGRHLWLGLCPTPSGLTETSAETVNTFERLRLERRNDRRLDRHLGVDYDTCHFAVEFETPQNAFAAFQQHGIKITKIHLSSGLKTRPSLETIEMLRPMLGDTHLHPVVIRDPTGRLSRHSDLNLAIAAAHTIGFLPDDEWRIFLRIPLHATVTRPFTSTTDHVLATLDLLAANPTLCSHLQIETHTADSLPTETTEHDPAIQTLAEYDWILARLAERGLA